MSTIRIINKRLVKSLLDVRSVIEGVERVYALKSQKQTELFPVVIHDFEHGVADMDIKSGHIKSENVFGFKLVTWFSQNSKKGLPALYGTRMLFNDETGVPLALLDAEHITGMRTGAAGAIGAKYLARKDSENMLMVGAGHQSVFQIANTIMAMDNLKRIMIYDPIDHDNAVKLSESIKTTIIEEFLFPYKEDTELYQGLLKKYDIEFVAVSDIKGATEVSDIIITATPSREPIIKREWVKKATHFSCVGSDMEGKQEIDSDIFKGARIFVDDMKQCLNVGECEKPYKSGVINEQDIISEIGDVIIGEAKGRTNEDEITIYDTTGLALQDLMISKLVYEIAVKSNIGMEAEL